MPTYEYECPACRSEFEVFQQISEPPVRRCPSCGKKPRRLISAGAGLIFKGSGFYQTDYRDDAYRSAARADTAPVKKDEGKTDGEKKDAGKKDGVKRRKTTPAGSGRAGTGSAAVKAAG